MQLHCRSRFKTASTAGRPETLLTAVIQDHRVPTMSSLTLHPLFFVLSHVARTLMRASRCISLPQSSWAAIQSRTFGCSIQRRGQGVIFWQRQQRRLGATGGLPAGTAQSGSRSDHRPLATASSVVHTARRQQIRRWQLHISCSTQRECIFVCGLADSLEPATQQPAGKPAAMSSLRRLQPRLAHCRFELRLLFSEAH